MFLKRESPEKDDFAIKNVNLTKISENVFAYSCVSEHSNYFNFVPTKTNIFLADKGFPPPH